MNSLRHFLLVAVILFAQMAAGVHAVAHAVENGRGEKGLPTHACELCLAAHDLGTALPSLTTLPLAFAPRLLPDVPPLHDRSALRPPVAVQRGPPVS